jgi:hypothetical protein
MALSQATAKLEKVIGHDDNAQTAQDISNPAVDRSKYADPSGEKMKALLWMGKNTVQLRKNYLKFTPYFLLYYRSPRHCFHRIISTDIL